MTQLPTFKKILAERFPDLKWVPEFVAPINTFMEETQRALGELRFGDNFDGVIKSVQIDGTYPVRFTWPKKMKPTVAWIGQCREVSGDHTTIATALYLDWEWAANGMFQINNVAGLTASPTSKFNLTIIAVTG